MKIGERIYRYAIATRASHWLWVIAFAALVSSGLQIFNAAPFLDASDTTNPAHRVLEIASPDRGRARRPSSDTPLRPPAGLVTPTTGWAGQTPRAFPAWITIPAYQDLADGRRWHLFFAWIMLLCWLAWLISRRSKAICAT
jgi:thiosulfate reductase cytochrome b subunit